MFLNILKVELKRAFCGYSFYLAVLVGFLGGFFGIGLASNFKFTVFHNSSAYLAWVDGMDMIVILAPIIAVLPFGDSLALDRASGIARYFLLRVCPKKYIMAKWLANASAGALAVALTIILTFIFAASVYPLPLPPEWVEWTEDLINKGENLGLVKLFVKTPALHTVFTACIGLLFGAAYATLALSFSVFLRSRYMILVVPFLFYWITSIVVDLAGFPGWAPWNVFQVFGALANEASSLLPSFLLLLVGTISLIPEVIKDFYS